MSFKFTGYRKILYALILNSIICVLFIVFGGVHYDIADSEVYSQYIAQGSYTINFINYFLCAFCGLIQEIIYPINAFAIIQIFFCFVSFVIITIVFNDKFGTVWSTLILLFLYAFFGVNHYSTISFTLTPALLSASGFLCLLHYINRKRFVAGIITGIFLLSFAAMYRFLIFSVSLSVVGLMYVVLSLINYCKGKETKKTFINAIKFIFTKKFIFVFLVMLVCTFSLNYGSQVINKSTDELIYYSQYTALRSAVWDYDIPSYEDAKQEYDEIGISKNDLLMLKPTYMDDDGAFSIETLENMVAIRDKYKSQKSLLNIAKGMAVTEVTDAIFAVTDKGMLLWALVIISLVYILLMKKKNYFILVSLYVVAFAFYFYLWCSGRCIYRAVYEIILCGIIVLLYSINVEELRPWTKKAKGKILFSFIALILVICGIILPLSFSSNFHSEPKEKDENYFEMLKYLEKNNNKKFEFTGGSLVSNIDNYENPLLIYTPEVLENTTAFGGCYYKTPLWIEQAQNFGSTNLFSYLIDNIDVYLVDKNTVNHAQMFEIYLNDHYSNGKNNIKMSVYDKVGQYTIYSFTTK